MQDKTFELLEKMYAEFNTKLDRLDLRLDNVEKEMQQNRNDVIRIENKMDSKLEALFDGYTHLSEKTDIIETKIDNLSDKVENHGIKIQVIEGSKLAK